MSISEPFRVTLLLQPDFPLACLSSVIEPLRAANEIVDRHAFVWTVTTADGDDVSASAGVRFSADTAFRDVTESDLVLILAQPTGRLDASDGTLGTIRRLCAHGTRIGAISGGICVLARHGLLDPDYRCSRHWCYRTAFDAAFPHLRAEEDLVVIDRNRFTASGAVGAFEMMLSLIHEDLGHGVMAEVACMFQHRPIGHVEVKQNLPAFARDTTREALLRTVVRAIELFETHLQDRIAIEDVAREVALSTRQLERQFKQTLDRSPTGYYRLIRLKAARQLVRHSGMTLPSIAAAVGFAKTATLRRQYRAEFGCLPSDERLAVDRPKVWA